MTQAALYINSKGYAVTRHSYSGSSDFNHCARYYSLKRISGWQERKQSAAMKFGSILENCVTKFHASDLAGALKEFEGLWGGEKNNTELVFSKNEGDWDDLNLSGQELLRLYAILYPRFEFTVPGPTAFQVKCSMEMFPGTPLAGLETWAYLDLIAKLKTGSFDPSLPSSEVILDMKVSTAECPTLISLDPQLRLYSWIRGIPTVGFLWFGKESRTLAKGTEVTLLEAVGPFKPGSKGYILSLDKGDIPIAPPSVYLAPGTTTLEEFDKIEGQSKAAKEARQKFIQEHGIIVPIASITRQTITVRTTVISEESRRDIRRSVEQDIVRIVHASEEDFFPMQGGVRFPNNKCTMCAMRGICSGNDALRDELLVRITE